MSQINIHVPVMVRDEISKHKAAFARTSISEVCVEALTAHVERHKRWLDVYQRQIRGERIELEPWEQDDYDEWKRGIL